MTCIEKALKYKKQGDNIQIHAYCVMNNHFHQSVTYTNGSENLSRFMRYSHGIFGARYNKQKSRSGKVAEGRPKTPRVQNDYHAMRLHFYIEANPIRAKFRTLENLKFYKYSSFGFYAYGIVSEFTYRLTIPNWYMNLGKTPQERKRKYRKLFTEYLGETIDLQKGTYLTLGIGDSLWLESFSRELRDQTFKLVSALTPGIKPIFSG